MNIDLRQCRHVLSLGQHRNFARAAAALGLTQPTLSRSLQALEKSVGARLFDRDRARVVPTPVGERLIEHARQLVNRAQAAEQDLQQLLGLDVGMLRIGAGPYPADLSMGAAVGQLIREHPGLVVDLSVANWVELTHRVASGDLDLAIADLDLARRDDHVAVEALPEHALTFFCRSGHPLARSAVPTMEELRRYPLVGTALPSRFAALGGRGDTRIQSNRVAGITAPEIQVATFRLALKIVLGSDAVSGATHSQIEDQLTDGSLVTLPIDLPWFKTAYGVIRPVGRTLSPAALAFLAILREIEARIP